MFISNDEAFEAFRFGKKSIFSKKEKENTIHLDDSRKKLLNFPYI